MGTNHAAKTADGTAARGFMLRAIRSARSGCLSGEGGPFGACIVRGGRVLAVSHNGVLRSKDATLHAEVRAIRLASKRVGSHLLAGCEIYSTTEPCVMCFAAIHWAGISRIYFGSRVADARRLGFNELVISNQTLKRLGKSTVEIRSDCCREECLELFRFWENVPGRRTY